MKIKVTSINYDLDDLEDDERLEALKSLPQDMEFDVSDKMDDDEIEDYVSEQITERTGYCHRGFEFNVLESPNESDEAAKTADAEDKAYILFIGRDFRIFRNPQELVVFFKRWAWQVYENMREYWDYNKERIRKENPKADPTPIDGIPLTPSDDDLTEAARTLVEEGTWIQKLPTCLQSEACARSSFETVYQYTVKKYEKV